MHPKWLLSVTINSDVSARFDDLLARRLQLGWCSQLQWWFHNLTIATQHWPVCLSRLLHHYTLLECVQNSPTCLIF